MRRRVAWTRLTALALSVAILLHAIVRALSQVWLGEALAMAEVAAAVLLARHRTRVFGVLLGAAALSLAAMAALLSSELSAAFLPLALTFGLLMLGRRLDSERNTRPIRTCSSDC